MQSFQFTNHENTVIKLTEMKIDFRFSLVAQLVKNLPAVQETQLRSLGQKDPLEKGTATHSSILAWRIPWTEEPGGPQSMGLHSKVISKPE